MSGLMKRCLLSVLITSPLSGVAAHSANVQIERIGTQDDGVIILYAKNGWGNVADNNCSSGAGVLAFKVDTDGGKALLSAALLAHSTQKTITVYTYDNACTSVGGMAPTIKRLDLLN